MIYYSIVRMKDISELINKSIGKFAGNNNQSIVIKIEEFNDQVGKSIIDNKKIDSLSNWLNIFNKAALNFPGNQYEGFSLPNTSQYENHLAASNGGLFERSGHIQRIEL